MRIRLAIIAVVIIVAFGIQAKAQNAYSYNWTSYDDSTGNMVSTCETDMDYGSTQFYEPGVTCYLDDQYGTNVAYGGATNTWGGSEVDVTIEATISPGVTYTGTTYSDLLAYTYIPGEYDDYYNFQSFVYDGIDALSYYDFLGPGPEEIMTGGNEIDVGATYQRATAPTCPRSISLYSTTAISLNDAFSSGYRTGVGIVASMLANPPMVNWNGKQVTESVTGSQGCPAYPFNTICQGSSTFTIGNANATIFGHTFNGSQNIFYDNHMTIGNASDLDVAGINSCTASCSQTYSCGGHTVGSFSINYSYSKDSLNSTPVTRVSVTKQ